MNLLGRWRIVEMPDYDDDFPDMMGPAYILFEDHGGGDTDAVSFSWPGNHEMDEAPGHGSAELQPNSSLTGQTCFHRGDKANFTARREASSVAC